MKQSRGAILTEDLSRRVGGIRLGNSLKALAKFPLESNKFSLEYKQIL